MKNFEYFVFCKNCLISEPFVAGDIYHIIPWGGLGWNDEIEVIHDYLDKNGYGGLTNREGTLSRAKVNQPVFVVCLRCRNSDEQAMFIDVIKQVELLNSVLAVQRNAYPEIFAVVVKDLDTGAILYKPFTPSYRGNLLPGSAAGENPVSIGWLVAKARENLFFRLCLTLYKEALNEEDINIAYYRFWALLEIIAKSRNYVGQPLCDWGGEVQKNQKGEDKKIEDKAEAVVFEHLRRTLPKMGMGVDSFSFGLDQGLITEQIPIWYRHRNCAAHYGGCFPDNLEFCDRNEVKFQKCRAAHCEMLSKHGQRDGAPVDQYFSSLRDLLKLLICREI